MSVFSWLGFTFSWMVCFSNLLFFPLATICPTLLFYSKLIPLCLLLGGRSQALKHVYSLSQTHIKLILCQTESSQLPSFNRRPVALGFCCGILAHVTQVTFIVWLTGHSNWQYSQTFAKGSHVMIPVQLLKGWEKLLLQIEPWPCIKLNRRNDLKLLIEVNMHMLVI